MNDLNQMFASVRVELNPWIKGRGKWQGSVLQATSGVQAQKSNQERESLPLLCMEGLLNEEGRTVAPLKALSKWLCCLASCSRVSSSLILWSLSACKALCQRLLWAWARLKNSLHSLGEHPHTRPMYQQETQQQISACLSN